MREALQIKTQLKFRRGLFRASGNTTRLLKFARKHPNSSSEWHCNTWLKFAPAWWRGLAPALIRLSVRGCNLNFGPVVNQPLDERTIRRKSVSGEDKFDLRDAILLAQMVRLVPRSSVHCFQKNRLARIAFRS